MSLYYEAAAALTAPASSGGNLKTRIFGHKNSSSGGSGGGRGGAAGGPEDKAGPAPGLVYALAVEAAKWSGILSEVIDAAGLLEQERSRCRALTPALALLLVHDLLVLGQGQQGLVRTSNRASGIRLPPTHGLRVAVERHKVRLAAELTRARLRRRASSMAALRELVEAETAAAAAGAAGAAGSSATVRWVRVNTLKTSLETQLASTFAGHVRVSSLKALVNDGRPDAGADADADADGEPDAGSHRRVYVDEHVPNIVAVLQRQSSFLTRSPAYKSGAIVFQDKASCFPAYLLDPAAVLSDDGGDGDFIDACAAPGNKTSHLAALVQQWSGSSHQDDRQNDHHRIFAFEKDPRRANTLHAMLGTAGVALAPPDGSSASPRLHTGIDSSSPVQVVVGAGHDFLQVDPAAAQYARVRALLLDPSCSGSGIVGRDAMPLVRFPKAAKAVAGKKRKRGAEAEESKDRKGEKGEKGEKCAKEPEPPKEQEDSFSGSGPSTTDTAARLAALAAFQLSLLLHAFRFPGARRVTYSTCSVHAEENEQVVVRALRQQPRVAGVSAVWRLLRRDEQVAGLQAWPVRGDAQGADFDADDGASDPTAGSLPDPAAVAEACIRSYPDDGRGVMGFFVACFVRDEPAVPIVPEGLVGPAGSAKAAAKRKKKKRTAKKQPSTEADTADEWAGWDD